MLLLLRNCCYPLDRHGCYVVTRFKEGKIRDQGFRSIFLYIALDSIQGDPSIESSQSEEPPWLYRGASRRRTPFIGYLAMANGRRCQLRNFLQNLFLLLVFAKRYEQFHFAHGAAVDVPAIRNQKSGRAAVRNCHMSLQYAYEYMDLLCLLKNAKLFNLVSNSLKYPAIIIIPPCF